MSIFTAIKSIFESNKAEIAAQIETIVNAEAPTLVPTLVPVATKVLADAGQSLPPEVVTALVSKILSSGIAELENYVNSKI